MNPMILNNMNMSTNSPDVPEPVAPLGGEAVEGSFVEFRWMLVRDATNYRVQIAADQSFENIWFDEVIGDTASLTLYDHLPERGQSLYWRIRSLSEGDWASWSEPVSFVVTGDRDDERVQAVEEPALQPEISPLIPSVVSPTAGARLEGIYVSIEWSYVSGASNYRVQVASDSSFQNLRFSETLGDTTSLTLIDYLPEQGHSFFWRIRSRTQDEWHPWSETYHFVAVTEEEAKTYEMEVERSAQQERPGEYVIDISGVDTSIPYMVGTTSVGQLSMVIVIVVLTIITMFMIAALFGSQAGQDVATLSLIPFLAIPENLITCRS